jgi:DnaJ like chaperone protein
MLRDSPEVLEELLDCLFEIAKADGRVEPVELAFLESVAKIFGFDQAAFARIRATHIGPDRDDPYSVLGVGHDASVEEIKAAYRRLIRDHHPDRLTAGGMPEEFLDVANQKMAAINDAYGAIRKSRGFT